MEAPKFLLADNSKFPNKLFILHNEYPRFLLDIETEEADFYEPVDESEEELETLMIGLLEEAFNFLEEEMKALDDDDDYGV